MVYLQLVLAMLFYGVSFVSTKTVLQEFGPVTILATRLALSSLFLIVLDRIIPSREQLRRWPLASDLRWILLLTLFQPLLYFLAENYGLQTVSATIASIIIATIPVFTPILARPFLGERIGVGGVVGVILSLVGVAIIVLERPDATGATTAQFTTGGLLLLFGAVLAAVGYTVVVRRLPGRYRPLSIVKMQSIIGLPIFLVMALAIDGVPRVLPSLEVGIHLAYLAIFPSSLAFVFFSTGIRKLGASRANVFTNLVPGFTAITAWILLGEQFSAQKLIGMAVVVAGVLTAQLVRSVSDRPDTACRSERPRAPQ